MTARRAAALALVAGWDSWRLLLARIDEPGGAITGAVLAAWLARAAWRADDTPVRAGPIVAALVVSAVAARTGPVLLQMAAAVAALVLALVPRGRWPVLALATLALPVLPTLDFLLAYPMRRASALITAGMLRMNGFDVGVDGVALAWGPERLLFDGPCSGVRMLWAALLLAGLVAAARGLPPVRFTLAMAAAAGLALFGNALRAAGLFYLEGGFVPSMSGPVAHETVGLVAFALVGGAALAFASSPRRTLA